LGPFDQLDDHAKHVLALAQDEAIRLKHNYIGTEHLLAGLVRYEAGTAFSVLRSLGVDLARVREALRSIVGMGDTEHPTEITLSPRTKRVLELAVEEAKSLHKERVSTEHLLLGLLREGQGIAAGILESLGLSLDDVRERVLRPGATWTLRGAPARLRPPAGRQAAWAPPLAGAVVGAAAALVASVALRGAVDWALAVSLAAGFGAAALVSWALARAPRGAQPAELRPVPTVTSFGARPGGVTDVVGATRPYEARSGGPFDRFNDRGKRVLALAQDEAIRLNHNYIGTEHLLLGLMLEGEGVAAHVLEQLGVDLSKVRTAVERIIGRGDSTTSPSAITLAPRTKKVIELAIDEARKLGHSHVGTEHLLLGLVREGEGVAAQALQSVGVSLEKVRHQVIATLGQHPSADAPSA
jgi:ATP-dependent Clp protease ATP-binding subunit ClpA